MTAKKTGDLLEMGMKDRDTGWKVLLNKAFRKKGHDGWNARQRLIAESEVWGSTWLRSRLHVEAPLSPVLLVWST
jgi:hypothetical protein